jgi:hypothetical protein
MQRGVGGSIPSEPLSLSTEPGSTLQVYWQLGGGCRRFRGRQRATIAEEYSRGGSALALSKQKTNLKTLSNDT